MAPLCSYPYGLHCPHPHGLHSCEEDPREPLHFSLCASQLEITHVQHFACCLEHSHIERELTSPFLFSGNQGSTILCTMLCGLPARHRVYTGIWKETLLGLQVSGVQRRVAGNLVISYCPFPTGEGRLMNMATSSSPGAIAKLLVNS